MENRSFENDLPSDNPPEDPIDNPPDSPSEAELQAGSSGITKEQQKETEPTYANTLDDEEDHESPPAYVQRHMPQEPKIDDIEELEQPVPIEEPQYECLYPEFQQARRRRERRFRQLLKEEPCVFRPDAPLLLPPPPEPEDQDRSSTPPASPPEPEDQDRSSTPPASPPTWSERFQNMYRRICIVSFQFPFHTFLLSWPLATCAMGVVNLTLCRINRFLPYWMLVVGLFGTASITLRLCVLYFEERLSTINIFSYWMWVRAAELIVWIFFLVELFLFFKQSPIFNPADRRYCKWKYYKMNCALMFLSSLTMLGWIVVNVTKLIQWYRRRIVPART